MYLFYWLAFIPLSLAQNPFCSKYEDHILERCGNNTQVSLRGLKTEHFAKDMRGAVLERSFIIRNRVQGINFSYTNNKQLQLRSSWFLDCQFDKASFLGSYIKRTDFKGSSFKGANFSGAKIENTSFKGADLRNANFENAVLMFVDFRGANIEGVSFEKTTLLSVKFK